MALVGSGKIKITNLNNIDDVVKKLLLLTNNEFNTKNRINELKGIESQSRDILELVDQEYAEKIIEDKDSTRMISNIKREYVLTSIMETISQIADYTDKVCCVIYLFNKKYHVMYQKTFKLIEIDTDFDYINEDNKRINSVIDRIYELITERSEELMEVENKFRSEAEDHIVSFMLDEHRDDLVRFKTGNFYRDLRRRYKEGFTNQHKEVIANFLKEYKEVKSRISTFKDSDYCKLFRIDEDVFRERRYDALKPLFELNALNLLA
jgi:hypothetical protein